MYKKLHAIYELSVNEIAIVDITFSLHSLKQLLTAGVAGASSKAFHKSKPLKRDWFLETGAFTSISDLVSLKVEELEFLDEKNDLLLFIPLSELKRSIESQLTSESEGGEISCFNVSSLIEVISSAS